jgi:hypothetical protein
MANQFGVRNGHEILCVENAGLQKGNWNRRATNRDWRGLVVCGTMVTRARSVSAAGTLTTNAGRTFAAMPRSTSQTSPRRATIIQWTRADRARQTADRRRREDPRLVAGHAATRLHDGQAAPSLRSVRAPAARRIARSVFSPPASCHQRPTMLGSGQEASPHWSRFFERNRGATGASGGFGAGDGRVTRAKVLSYCRIPGRRWGSTASSRTSGADRRAQARCPGIPDGAAGRRRGVAARRDHRARVARCRVGCTRVDCSALRMARARDVPERRTITAAADDTASDGSAQGRSAPAIGSGLVSGGWIGDHARSCD